jgi:hypothetical protein
MKKFWFVLMAGLLAVAFMAGAVFAEYYIVQKASGKYAVAEHKAKGEATTVAGPFDTEEQARKALEGYEKGTKSSESKEDGNKFYVIKTRAGDYRVVNHRPEGNAKLVDGPFDKKDQAEQAMKEAKKSGKSDKEQARDMDKGNYFVIERKSGEYAVVDHRPKGRAEVVNGPFETKEQAQDALQEAKKMDKKSAQQAEADQEGEYYVAKTRSGSMKVVDHKPRGQAEAVKGPFESREEAQQAVKSAQQEDKARGEDRKKSEAKGEKKSKQQFAYCLPPDKAKRMASWYVVKDDVGRMTVKPFSGDDPILFGPFRHKRQAVQSMWTGRCAR